MAEEIKRELSECTKTPKFSPYVCITAGRLGNILERIKKLNSKDFLNVYEFAKDQDLPKDFLEELKFEYQNRDFI